MNPLIPPSPPNIPGFSNLAMGPAFTFPALLVLGLAGLLLGTALFLVAGVAWKSPRPIPAVRRIKSGLGTLLWVVPAIAIVGLIGSRARPVFDIPQPSTEPQSVTVDSVSWSADSDTAVPQPPTTIVMVSRPHAGSLTLRGEVTEAPRWGLSEEVSAEAGPELDPAHPVFRSKRYATTQSAVDEVTRSAVDYLQRKFRTELNSPVTIDAEMVDRLAVDQLVVEKFLKEFPLTEGEPVKTEMYIAHLQLNLGPQLRDAVYAQWRAQTVNKRLQVLGGGLVLVTLLLGTVSTYLRLDDATEGRYRTRLKMAAAAVVAAAGMTALVIA